MAAILSHDVDAWRWTVVHSSVTAGSSRNRRLVARRLSRMKRAALLVPLLFAAALLAACDAGVPPCGGAAITTRSCSPAPPEQTKLNAELVEFVPDYPGGLFTGATSDSPIDVALLHAWRTDATGGDAEPRDPNTALDAPDVPGMTYVALSASTYCRVSDTAELFLRGTDLVVQFGGGEDHQECARQYNAYVQFAVPEAEAATAVTVGGSRPVGPDGPAVLTHFVPLGVLDAGAAGIEPTRFGWGAAPKMREDLIAVGTEDSGELREALPDEQDEDSTALAFVLSGCAEDGAKLVLTPSVISAELTGGEDTDCESASWFLAVFTVENTYAQWEAELAVYGR